LTRPKSFVYTLTTYRKGPLAPLAELVDALDSKSSSERSAGSIPAWGTIFPCALPPINPLRGFDFAALGRNKSLHDAAPTFPSDCFPEKP
jgi:hypothetical protein